MIHPVVGFIGDYDSSKETLYGSSGSTSLKLNYSEVDAVLFRSVDWLSNPSTLHYCIHRFPPTLPFSGTRVSFYDSSRPSEAFRSQIIPIFCCVESPRITGATALLTCQFLDCLLPHGLSGLKPDFVLSPHLQY